MSYAIIRNAKYKRENLKAVYRHNERKNKNYSNKDINDIANWMNNYPRKIFGYKTSFEMLRQEIKDDNLFNKLFAKRTFVFLINKKELKYNSISHLIIRLPYLLLQHLLPYMFLQYYVRILHILLLLYRMLQILLIMI